MEGRAKRVLVEVSQFAFLDALLSRRLAGSYKDQAKLSNPNGNHFRGNAGLWRETLQRITAEERIQETSISKKSSVLAQKEDLKSKLPKGNDVVSELTRRRSTERYCPFRGGAGRDRQILQRKKQTPKLDT